MKLVHTISVLYVDDEEDLLEVGKLYLERTKEFSVTTAASALAGLALLQSNGIQAIVSDYQMPNMNGIEFLKQVRAIHKRIPFIIFTGRGREEVAIQAFENGADFYIQKGGEPESQFIELAHKIRSAVSRKEGEVALQENQIKLANAMNLAQIVNWEYDVRSGLFSFDDRFYALYGTTGEQEGGKLMPAGVYIREFVHPDDIPYVTSTIKDVPFVTDPNYSVQMEHRIIRRDGQVRHIVVRFAVIMDSAGKVTKTYGANQDITERKLTEETLKVAQEKYTKAFLSAPDAITISELDSGRFVEVNDSASRIFGYTRDELIGKSALGLGIWQNKENRDAFIDKLVKQGRVSGFEIVERRKSGELFTASVNADTITIGSKRYLIATIRDITERKQIENALRESEQRLITAQRIAKLGDITWDVETGEITWSDALYEMMQYDKSEKIDFIRVNAEIHHPDDLERVSKWLNDCISSGSDKITPNEYRIIRKDGKILFVRTMGVIQRGEGKRVKVFVTLQDITERKQAEDALRESEYRFRELFNSMSSGVAVYRAVDNGADFVFVDFNRRAEIIEKIPKQDVIGKRVSDVFPGVFEFGIMDVFRRVWQTGTSEHHPISMYKDERIASWRENFVYRLPSGEIVAIYDDITERRRAEEALRESETRYRNVVEDQTEFISRFLPDGTHVFVNEAYCRYFGKTRDEIIGHLFVPGIPQEDQEIVRKHFRSLTPDKPVATVDHRIIMPDGSVRWQRWSDRAIFDSRGNIVEFQSVGRDITETKQVERELRNSEHLRQDIIAHLPDPTFVINEKGTVIAWNKALEGLTGVPARDMVGKGNYAYAVPFYGVRKPILIDLILNYDEEILKKYNPVQHDGKTLVAETTNARPHGQPAILWIKASPIYDENGRLIGAIETIRDITEHKQAEQLLRDSEERFRELFQRAAEGILVADIETQRFIHANPAICRMLGYSYEELISMGVKEIHPKEDLPGVTDEFMALARGEKTRATDIPCLRKDGTIIYADVVASQGIIDGKMCNIGLFTDITDRKRAEEEVHVTREKYIKAFLSVPEAITISELESGRFIEVNDAASALFGYTRDELIGKNAHELGIWLNKEERDAFVEQVKKQGRVEQVRVEERRKSGERFNASITADTMTIGNTQYLIAATRDITRRKQMEEAVRESETRYRNVVEDQTEFISRFLPDGTHVFVNDAYCRYFGKTRDEIIGHLFVPGIPKEDKVVVREHFRSLTPKNPVATVDHRIIMPDGSVRWQRWSDRAIFDSRGKIVEYQSVGRDITETKQVERELKSSEHLRQDIIDHLPDPTFVINEKGIVIAWNKAMEGLTGVPARDMVGKSDYEYAVPFYGVRQPILIDLAIHYDEEVLKKYNTVLRDGTTLVVETTNARPRGKPAVLWAKASPIYDENGRHIGAIETIRDITERKRVEDALAESEERYSSLFDNNYSVSLLIDPDTGKIVDANAAAVRYYGYSHDGLTKLGIYDLNRLSMDKVVRDLQQAKHEKAKHFFSTHYLASGQRRNVEIYSGPITVQGKVHFYSIIHDVTEQKQAERALVLTNKKLNLLSGITRHDIKNQLMALIAFLELSKESIDNPATLSEFLKKSRKIADTIAQQITFTKEYEDLGVKAPSWQNVNAGIAKAVAALPLQAVQVSVDRTDLEVFADPLFLKVFYNLLDNALKYGEEQMRTIRVSSYEKGDTLILACEDDGVGISAEDKKSLFTKGFGKNTGLGLFLTREILSITGITITENGTAGKGARFEITVPKGAYRFTGTQ